MTDLLSEALEATRNLSAARRDEIAEVVLHLADESDGVIALSTEEKAAIKRSKAAAARGEFATDEQVRAVWAKHGLLRLRYTLPALADLEAILDGVAEFSPNGSRRIKERIHSLTDRLLLHPLIGRRTDDPTLRRIVISPYPYLVFYEPTSDEIIVHAIRHTARNPASMPGRPDEP